MRAQGRCTAVLGGGCFFLVDVGPGSWRGVALQGLPPSQLTAVLLTHFHSDHIGDLGEAIETVELRDIPPGMVLRMAPGYRGEMALGNGFGTWPRLKGPRTGPAQGAVGATGFRRSRRSCLCRRSRTTSLC